MCDRKSVRVNRDLHHVLAGGNQGFINFGGTKGPHLVERTGLLGRLKILECGRYCHPAADIPGTCNSWREAKTVFVRHIHIYSEGVFTLVEGVQFRRKPVPPPDEVVRLGTGHAFRMPIPFGLSRCAGMMFPGKHPLPGAVTPQATADL